MTKHYIKFLLAAILIGWMILAFASLGHCSVNKPRPNSLGVAKVYDNPWSYMVGSPKSVNLFEQDEEYYTNVTFKALGDSMLNDVTILFCGNEQSAFADGKLRAVTYHTSASRKYQGIGCHDILPIQGGVIVIE